MSMIGNYLRVTNEELTEYLGDSSRLERRVYDEGSVGDPNHLDIDKSWEGIFFLLTGQSLATSDEANPPFSWILLGPKEIDSEQDMGYGPATYTTPEQTKELSAAINKLTLDEIKSRFKGEVMNEMGIYPVIWSQAETREYLFDHFNLLKDFYTVASTNNQAVIIFIN